MKKEFSAGLITYRNTPQGPRFLLLYHGGRYWNFPKGHIEYKKADSEVVTFVSEDKVGEEVLNVRETSKEAAIRETFEETGIVPEKMNIKKGFRAVEKFRFTKNRELVFKVVIFYLCETTETAVKISSEHDGFGWFLYKDARYILSPYKDGQKLLKSAYDFIRPKEKTVQEESKETKPSVTRENAYKDGYQARRDGGYYMKPRKPQTFQGERSRDQGYRNQPKRRNFIGRPDNRNKSDNHSSKNQPNQ